MISRSVGVWSMRRVRKLSGSIGLPLIVADLADHPIQGAVGEHEHIRLAHRFVFLS